jgi:hypothetical protein
MNRWIRREVQTAGRHRIHVSLIFFWEPLLLTAVLLFVIWLTELR